MHKLQAHRVLTCFGLPCLCSKQSALCDRLFGKDHIPSLHPSVCTGTVPLGWNMGWDGVLLYRDWHSRLVSCFGREKEIYISKWKEGEGAWDCFLAVSCRVSLSW